MINMQKIKNYQELTTEKGDLKARRKVLQFTLKGYKQQDCMSIGLFHERPFNGIAEPS